MRLKRRWQRLAILLLSVLIACLCGYADGIGRVLSLSRTLYFLPFVLLGCFLPKETDFAKHKKTGLLLGVAALGLFLLVIRHLPVEFLYGADSFELLGVAYGAVARLFCILIAAGIGGALLCLLPRKSLSVSKIGVDTLLIYLLHGPLVKAIGYLELGKVWFALLAPVLAVLIYLGLYLVFGRGKRKVQIVP